MFSIFKNAFIYFLVIFIFGFVFGTIRVLWLTPKIGEIFAILLEVPIMICISYFIAGRIIANSEFPKIDINLLMMGEIAFVLLIASEFLLGIFGFGRSFEIIITNLISPAGMFGLFGQVIFGIIPFLRHKFSPINKV